MLGDCPRLSANASFPDGLREVSSAYRCSVPARELHQQFVFTRCERELMSTFGNAAEVEVHLDVAKTEAGMSQRGGKRTWSPRGANQRIDQSACVVQRAGELCFGHFEILLHP